MRLIGRKYYKNITRKPGGKLMTEDPFTGSNNRRLSEGDLMTEDLVM